MQLSIEVMFLYRRIQPELLCNFCVVVVGQFDALFQGFVDIIIFTSGVRVNFIDDLLILQMLQYPEG